MGFWQLLENSIQYCQPRQSIVAELQEVFVLMWTSCPCCCELLFSSRCRLQWCSRSRTLGSRGSSSYTGQCISCRVTTDGSSHYEYGIAQISATGRCSVSHTMNLNNWMSLLDGRKLSWFGHVYRHDTLPKKVIVTEEDRPSKQVMEYNINVR